jgi:hypothetical protein
MNRPWSSISTAWVMAISDVSVMAMVAQRHGRASTSDGPAGTWADG